MSFPLFFCVSLSPSVCLSLLFHVRFFPSEITEDANEKLSMKEVAGTVDSLVSNMDTNVTNLEDKMNEERQQREQKIKPWKNVVEV